VTAARRRSAAILLVGCGKMGAALLAGWQARRIPGPFHVVEPAPSRRIKGARFHATPATLPRNLKPAMIVLAVKPQAFGDVLPAYRSFAQQGAAVLSIAAGQTIAGISRGLGGGAVLRAMPNTPASIGRGMTVACAGPGVTSGQRALANRLLAAVGEIAWVADEMLLDPVTAVSGSGPAYVFYLIECLAKAGAAEGLPPDLANQLARATVAGAGALARQAKASAAQLRENVTSPGGTTRAALDVLMAPDGLESLMRRAVAAAARRSRELPR